MRSRSGAIRAAAWLASVVGTAWLLVRARRYRAATRTLTETERNRLNRWFSPGFLDHARVAEPERIENPLGWGLLPPRWRPGFIDLTRVVGMAFPGVVVLPRSVRPAGEAGISVLFHELVHAAQYRALGVRGFAGEYAASWLEQGRDYFSITLEAEAFEWQRAFDRGGAARRVDVEVAARWSDNT